MCINAQTNYNYMSTTSDLKRSFHEKFKFCYRKIKNDLKWHLFLQFYVVQTSKCELLDAVVEHICQLAR